MHLGENVLIILLLIKVTGHFLLVQRSLGSLSSSESNRWFIFIAVTLESLGDTLYLKILSRNHLTKPRLKHGAPLLAASGSCQRHQRDPCGTAQPGGLWVTLQGDGSSS